MKVKDDESSEDETERLRQAVDSTLFRDDMFKNFNKGNDTAVAAPKKSLRHLDNEQRQQDVKVSTEMQRCVGERLRKLIDSMVRYVEVQGHINTLRSPVDGGVKLFRDSEGYLTTDAPAEVNLRRKDRKKIKRRRLDVEEVDATNLDVVAVSAEYILSGDSIRHWRSRRKERLERYQEETPGGALLPLD